MLHITHMMTGSSNTSVAYYPKKQHCYFAYSTLSIQGVLKLARPDPQILEVVEEGKLTWQITSAEKLYVITYKDRPIGVRTIAFGLGRISKKYKKMSYQHLGNAKLTARRFNATFNCQDFAVLDVFANITIKDLK